MFRFGLKKDCPQCASRRIRRASRRGDFEKHYLPFFLLSPFRCESCGLRFLGLYFTVGLIKKAREVLQEVTVEQPHDVPAILCESYSRPIYSLTDLDLGLGEPRKPCGQRRARPAPRDIPLQSRSAGGSC
jgi:hypothetical protein